MSERVRVRAGGHRAAIGLLILASLVFLPVFGRGQCKEPANPKAERTGSTVDDARMAAAAGGPSGKGQKAAIYAGSPGKAPAQVMVYRPPLIQVPDLSNKTLDEVKAEVANKLTIRTVNNDNSGWIVERQFPVRFSSVAVCSALELWMKAPPQRMTKVPPIVGVPENQIPSLLEKYHLRYGGSTPKETTAAPGTIFDQDPKPETPEPWGYEVIAYKATRPPPVVPLSVSLTANTLSVKPGDTVRFVARLEPDAPDAQYVFSFGEGPATVPGGPETTHRFDQDGDFDVSVTATSGNREAQSEPVHITVHSTEYHLTVTWAPQHPVVRQTVTFTASLSPADPLIAKGPYYFYFGDKAKPKPSGDVYSQAFAKPGTYPVRVMLRGEHGHTIQNDPPQQLVVMKEVPLPLPSGWWVSWGKYVVPPGVIALICGFAGLHFVSKYLTGLVGLRAMGRVGGVHLHQDGREGLEAAFGFRLEQPVATATARFRGAVILKVERIG
jgi:hypothetical protein